MTIEQVLATLQLLADLQSTVEKQRAEIAELRAQLAEPRER